MRWRWCGRSLTTPGADGPLAARWTPTRLRADQGQRASPTRPRRPANGTGSSSCEVLEVIAEQSAGLHLEGRARGQRRLRRAPGHGGRPGPLSTVEAGTRVRLVHSGFVLPKNETAFKNMSAGWTEGGRERSRPSPRNRTDAARRVSPAALPCGSIDRPPRQMLSMRRSHMQTQPDWSNGGQRHAQHAVDRVARRPGRLRASSCS